MTTKPSKALVMMGLLALCTLTSSSTACADSVTLTLSALSGSPGGVVTVDGTITNGTTDTVYLNGENFTLGSPSLLNGDPTDFFLNAPISLAPGADSGLIALFTFDIAPGTVGGTYGSNFLDVIGGTDPSDFTDVLASSEFSVNVTGAPEPGTVILLCAGLIAALALRRPSRSRQI